MQPGSPAAAATVASFGPVASQKLASPTRCCHRAADRTQLAHAVARPLREQFAIALFVLLLPVGTVMTIAWSQVYSGHMRQLYDEASGWELAIVAHLEVGWSEADSALREFIKLLPLPEGTT